MAGSRDELLSQLKEVFDSDPQGLISLTSNLTEGDVAMIGKVIQIYCYADFNGRRIVDALRHAATGKARVASRLQDAQVFEQIEILANNHLWEGNLKEGLLKASATIEMHRVHRHNFAHWAARRVNGANALIMFTTNAREGERRDGKAHEPGEAKYAILPLDGFSEEVEKLQSHGNYLAQTAAHIEKHLPEFREEFEKRRGSRR